VVVNIQDQKNRHNSLKVGEKEFISTFKLLFDDQVKANDGVGVSEPVRERERLFV
jgi:hypothetical protein